MTESAFLSRTGLVSLSPADPALEIWRLVLERPEKLNALTPPMLADIAAALDHLEGRGTVRCLILEGAGGRAFCAGADIAAWSRLAPKAMWQQWILSGLRLFDRLAQWPVPTVAAIDGIAFGGGLELAVTADFRVCTPASRFALPETGIGAVPGWGGERRLVTLLGLARAKQIALLGEPIDAATARDWGLVVEVAADVRAAALKLAGKLAGRAPLAQQATKSILNAAASEGTSASLSGLAAATARACRDADEGIASFFEKRPATFSGE